MKKITARAFGPLAILGVMGLALLLLIRELHLYHYHDLMRQVWTLPHSRLLLAIGLTALAYLVLTGYDAIALRYVGHALPIRRIALGSFVAYAVSHNIGFPLLSGGPVRYRFWSVWGLSTSEIAQALSFAGSTFLIGMIAVGGTVLLLEPQPILDQLHVSPLAATLAGSVCVAMIAGYIGLTRSLYKTFRVLEWEFPVPSTKLAISQLVVAVLDWSLAAAVLYVLLPSEYGLQFIPLLGVFVIAQFAGIISHVPGGLGVFEAIVVLLLKAHFPAAVILGALIAYRGIYYVLPLVVALAFLAAFEAERRRTRVAGAAAIAGEFVGRWVPAILPQLLSVATFLGGTILIISGATPALRRRVFALHEVVPLPIIELSHFAASMAGAGLIILAWAIRRRLDAAYSLTIGTLLIGIVASLLKGLDWEEALALTIVLIALIPSRGAFYRKAAMTSEPFPFRWIIAVVLLGAITTWLAFFSFKNANFTGAVWWQFSLRGDAPRSLRAMIGVIGALLLFAFSRKLRHAEADPTPPSPRELELASRIATDSPDTLAKLALLGDKALLFSDTGRSMIMYAVEGRSWVALGDPIGVESERSELAWRFKERADEHGGWPVFYEVSAHFLPIYIELGLTLLKIGEEAMVPLRDFSLEGGGRKALRRTRKDVVNFGATFEIVPAANTPCILPELSRISEEWLKTKRTKEKGFSLGRFDARYLSAFPIAVVRVGQEMVAFANLWTGAHSSELSVDLMRYTSKAPPGVMEYLLIELMLWGKENAYQRFNLGMAPLSGFESRSLAPLWTRIGALVFNRGEPFYNFQGLRLYKEKFDPGWEPRYLASPGGLVLPRILTNVASLISGGLTGVVTK